MNPERLAVDRVEEHPVLRGLTQPHHKRSAEAIGVERVLAATHRLHRLEDTWAYNGHSAPGGADGCYSCQAKVVAVLEAAELRRLQDENTELRNQIEGLRWVVLPAPAKIATYWRAWQQRRKREREERTMPGLNDGGLFEVAIRGTSWENKSVDEVAGEVMEQATERIRTLTEARDDALAAFESIAGLDAEAGDNDAGMALMRAGDAAMSWITKYATEADDVGQSGEETR